MNFHFSFNSSFTNKSGSKKSSRRLTPQEEYWLNRILRDHAGQIFLIILCFFLFILGTVVFAVLNKDKLSQGGEFSFIYI